MLTVNDAGETCGLLLLVISKVKEILYSFSKPEPVVVIKLLLRGSTVNASKKSMVCDISNSNPVLGSLNSPEGLSGWNTLS